MNSLLTRFLLPGELYVSKKPCRIHTILGSCVAVVLYNHVHNFGGMNHYMLAEESNYRNERGNSIYRYGDRSTEKLISEMEKVDPDTGHLHAKLFGGCAVLSELKDSRIGDDNIRIARKILKNYGIPVKAEFLQKKFGLKIEFHNFNNKVFVKKIAKTGFVTKYATANPTSIDVANAQSYLVITDSPEMRRVFLNWGMVSSNGIRLETTENLFTARTLIKKNRYHTIVLDMDIPHLVPGEFLKNVADLRSDVGVVLLAGTTANVPFAVKNLRGVLEKKGLCENNYREYISRHLVVQE